MKQTFICAFISVLWFTCLDLHAQGLKIGHTRIDYILSQLPETKAATNKLTVEQTQAQTELKRIQKELQDKFAVYQKEGSRMTEAVRKDRETELQGIQTRMQEFSRTADDAIQNKYRQLMSPIISKVQQTIDTVAKQNGYTHIVNIGSGASADVLYAPEEYDISGLVLKKLGVTPGQNESLAPSAAAPAKATAPKAAPRKK